MNMKSPRKVQFSSQQGLLIADCRHSGLVAVPRCLGRLDHLPQIQTLKRSQFSSGDGRGTAGAVHGPLSLAEEFGKPGDLKTDMNTDMKTMKTQRQSLCRHRYLVRKAAVRELISQQG